MSQNFLKILLKLNLILIFSICQLLPALAKNSNKINDQDILTLEEVKKSALKNYPIIFSHYDKIRSAESKLLSAKGFFDIRLKQNYSDRTRGFYDGKTYDAEIEKNIGILGANVYGGYRKSYGKFPIYEGSSNTNSGGEYRIGAKFSLLKDREIDKNRLSLILENLGIEEAKIELENIKMEIVRDASKAYWAWVCAGKILQIYQDLYELSVKRQKQFEIKSQKGDIAKIIMVENRKNLLKRQASLNKIKQEFEASSIYLSLFLRDAQGNPQNPKLKKIPDLDMNLPKIPDEHEVKKIKQIAISRRPEIRAIDIKSNKEKGELKYAKNLLNPQLDIEIGASKDEGKGPVSRSQSNNYANLSFSLPLQQREAKGRVNTVESNISAISYEKALLEDLIKVEIDQIILQKLTISETYKILNEEANLAEDLQNAEIEKFKQGVSNFFLVNIREQDYASSKASIIEVYKEFKNAEADYNLAIFDYKNVIDD